MKERCIVLQLPLMGLIHLILPLLFQFCNTLAITKQIHSNTVSSLFIIYLFYIYIIIYLSALEILVTFKISF